MLLGLLDLSSEHALVLLGLLVLSSEHVLLFASDPPAQEGAAYLSPLLWCWNGNWRPVVFLELFFVFSFVFLFFPIFVFLF